jgi:hypothetical protein
VALTLVSDWPPFGFGVNGNVSGIGPYSTVPGNAEGNLLILFGVWNTSAQDVGFAGTVPASSVADSQGNWWQLIGDSGNTGSAARCAIWMCSNPLAIPAATANGWVSFALQGYTASATWQLSEFSGVPYGYAPQIDFITTFSSGTNGAVTSIPLTATTSTADYVFSLAAATVTSSITGPGAPFTVDSQGSSGAAAPAEIWAANAYATVAANTAVTGSWTVASSYAAGVMVGISQATFTPVTGNPNFPVIKTELALGAVPGDATTGITDTAWTDITSYTLAGNDVASIEISRGRQYELSQPEAGTLNIALSNLTGAFNPTNVGSPFYSNALNANMSFQSGLAPWSAGAGGVIITQVSSPTFATGVNAIAYSSMLVTPSAGASAAVSERVAVSVNSTYSGSAWVNSPGGWANGAHIQVNWFTAGGSPISTSTGSNIPLSAGTWTFVSFTGITPPATSAFAALIVSLNGSPTSSNPFNVAEAALVAGGSAVSTGLVQLGTPVRVSAFWHGRRYAVGSGFVERWPQVWPDMRQWGFSLMIATDQIGVVTSVNLPSAVQGEILADGPYFCFPFSESYSTSSNTANGVQFTAANANGLIAVNTSRSNQKTATYIGSNIQTGQSIGFLGDSGTAMGVTGLSSPDFSGFRQSGAIYGPDTALPGVTASSGITVEYWAIIPNPGVTVLNTWNVTLYTTPSLGAQPAAAKVNWPPGWYGAIGVEAISSSQYQILIEHAAAGITASNSISINWGALTHVMLVIKPGGAGTCYLNGGNSFAVTTNFLQQPLVAVTLGQAPYTYSPSTPGINYSQAYSNIYSYAMSPARIASHYSAGVTGFSGDSISTRFGRYLAWATLGLSPGGPGSSITDAFQLSAAYATNGTALADALNSDAISSGATWYCSGNGNLVLLPRPTTFNTPSSVTFGDNALAILNANAFFTNGSTSSWSALNGTISATSSPPAGAQYHWALLFTISGAGAAAAEESGTPFAASASTQYTIGAWVFTTQSTVIIGFDWQDSSHSFLSTTTATLTVQASTWTFVQTTQISDSSAAFGYARIAPTLGAGNSIYTQAAVVTLTAGEVAYDPAFGLDYDNTYVQNVTQGTLTQGPSTLISPVEKSQSSINQYFTRGPQAVTVSGSSAQDAYDVAYWRLSKYAQPRLRVQQVTVNPMKNPLFFTKVLQTDVADVAVTNRRPVGAQVYSLPVIIQKVDTKIGPGVYTVTYQQSPYVQEGEVLTADVSPYDNLGSNVLGW